MTDTTAGPYQLAERLGLMPRDITRGRETGVIPPPDTNGGHRWSGHLVDEMAARADQIRAAVGANELEANR